MPLDGKVVIVTGGARKRGRGHAIALRPAKEGVEMVITDKMVAPRPIL